MKKKKIPRAVLQKLREFSEKAKKERKQKELLNLLAGKYD